MSENSLSPQPQNSPDRKSFLMGVWENLSHAGLAEIVLRLGTDIVLIALILFIAWGLRSFYTLAQSSNAALSTTYNPRPTLSLGQAAPELATLQPDAAQSARSVSGITRQARIHTDVPSQPRLEISHYTVQAGDTLFGIADKFGLKPETILWANQAVLADNPHNLRPGQELIVLPVDGAYHRWSAGDGLNGVASFFGVRPEDIVSFPGNRLDSNTLGDWSNPNIEAGMWLIIPGGRREFVSWSAPDIPRDNPGIAKVLGPGACEDIPDGAIGNGIFIWPADRHVLSGFDYEPSANHPGIDIDGNDGDPVYAADNGVIVYAGWNSWGYGNVIVISHGNGWQTLYAHLSNYFVSCGQSVMQGGLIAQIGATGNATGSHLHFEMMYNGVKVNPHDYIR